MKSKRGIHGKPDNLWRTVKHGGDLAIYARCRCGFEYSVQKEVRGEDGCWLLPREADPAKMYHFCPNCGSRKTKYTTEIKHTPWPWE